MKHLRQLEDQSVYIMREAYKHFDNLAMLWSMGKDSTVLLWLARKAFFGHVPFPLLHVDTSYKIPAMIEYRDRLAREWRLQRYHMPSDDLTQPIDFEAGAQTARLNYLIGWEVANTDARPMWKAGDFFGGKFGGPMETK